MAKLYKYESPFKKKWHNDWDTVLNHCMDDIELSSGQLKRAMAVFKRIYDQYDAKEITEKFRDIRVLNNEDAKKAGAAVACSLSSSRDVLLECAKLCAKVVQLEDEIVQLNRKSIKLAQW